MATAVPTFCINTPIWEERAPEGTSFPVKIFVSCFAPPDGYLVGITRTKICESIGVSARFNALIASGLLSSIPISTWSGLSKCCKTRQPSMTSWACSCIKRSSAVMYGSHSAALIINVLMASLPPASLDAVGKPAPPRPAIPACSILLSKSARESCWKLGSGCKGAQVSKPSDLILTHSSFNPEGCAVTIGSMATMVPDVEAWTGTVRPEPLVSGCPLRTVSPTLTISSPSGPKCCCSGIINSSGTEATRIGVWLDCSFISGG